VPASSSIANIPALNFSTTLPMTSIASSFGKFILYPFRLIWRGRLPAVVLTAATTTAAISAA
jgi:hypothetical protein